MDDCDIVCQDTWMSTRGYTFWEKRLTDANLNITKRMTPVIDAKLCGFSMPHRPTTMLPSTLSQVWQIDKFIWFGVVILICCCTEHLRNSAGLSTEGIQVTPTERVFLSLLCPLPNEQDFAINVCSLLAMESRRPFPLHQCPRIVDALLAHAGIFSQGLCFLF